MSSVLDHVSTFGARPLPSGWRGVTLEDIVADDGVFVDGDWVESKDQDPAGDVRLIQLADVGDGEYRDRSERFLTSERALDLGCTFLEPGDLLIARMPDPLGRACIFPGDRKRAVTVVDVAVVRPRNPELNTRWLMYCINAPQFRRVVASLQSGSTRKRISRKNLAKIVFPLPPLHWQDEVVAEIEKQFSRLDEAVANLKRVKANLKRYKAAVLKTAIEGCLVPTEADLARHEGRTPATASELIRRILDDGRHGWSGLGKYKEPVPVEFDGLPALPDGWAWATVGQLAAPEPNSITDGPFGSNLKTEHYRDSGPRVIRLQNIGDGEFVDEEAHISEEHFASLRKHEVHAGDLVIATLGENPPRACVLPAHVGPAIVKADCIRFRPHPSLNARYLNAALNALPTRQRTKDRLHGVGRPRLSLGEIKSIPLPLPPVQEQARIAAEIDRLLSVNEEVSADVNRRLAAADRLRRSVLHRAFRGAGADGEVPRASHGRDRGDSVSAESSTESLPDTTGENLMSVVKKTGIREALEANLGWLSTSDLLAAAGLPPAAEPEEMEQFYLQLREVLRSGTPVIEVQRRDGVDYFRKG